MRTHTTLEHRPVNRPLILVIGLVLSLAVPSMGSAQLVRVGGFGGVSVRAPFVAVDVLPFGGGTRVRAPFTAVNTGLNGYGYAPYPVYRYHPGYYVDGYTFAEPFYPPQPHYVAPAYALPVNPASVNSDLRYGASISTASIDQQLRASAVQLQQNLAGRRDDGDIWINYLEPDRIIAVLDRGESPEQLRQLLNNYIGVTGNNSLSSIWTIGGFRETYRLLDRFISEAGDLDPSSKAMLSEPNALGSSILEPDNAAAVDPIQAQKIERADQDERDRQRTSGDQGAGDQGNGDSHALPTPVPDLQ